MKPPEFKPAVLKKEGWVEHLEKEVDPNLREDLEVLLKNSGADRKVFAALKTTRELVKRSDDVLMPESGLYFDSLHEKIMAAIDQEPQRGSKISRSRSIRGFAWRSYAGAAGMTMSMMMMLAFVSWTTVKSAGNPDSRATAASAKSTDHFERELAGVAVPTTDVSNELNGYESKSEFVTAALEQKLKNMSPDQANALFAALEK
jgi:hypothetical protein